MGQGVNEADHSPASPAAQRWASQLAAWAIPPQILAQAPTSPWVLPVELFRSDGEAPDSPSHRLARQALGQGPARVLHEGTHNGSASVLDLGCGGGRAAFALVPPATAVTGVDRRGEMLAEFAAAAQRRGVPYRVLQGEWPQIAEQAPVADVVVAHHVVYNVPDLAAFAVAANAHARRRVVLELPVRHPLSWMAPLWRHFWGLERPSGPSAHDALAVIREAGLDAKLERWADPAPRGAHTPFERRVELTRTRLCLNASRDAEVAAQLRELDPAPRELAALWWDQPSASREGVLSGAG